jgi:hypothetical protein
MVVFHGTSSPGVPTSAIRRTPPPQIQRERFGLHARMSMAHSMEQCEVSITMPLNPMESWMAAVIGVELDDPVEQTAQVALTCVGVALLTLLRCQSHSSQFAIGETPCGSSALRPYPTPRVLTSTYAQLQWLSMLNTCSTCSTPPSGLSSSSACVWLLKKSTTSSSHATSRS